MFTINEIKEAHKKVKSGADFPLYFRALINLGVSSYDTYVTDGHSEYAGKDNFTISSRGNYAPIPVAGKPDKNKFGKYLKMHQQGETDYPAFCRHAAESGIERWKLDMTAMTCTYYDKEGHEILQEKIPSPEG